MPRLTDNSQKILQALLALLRVYRSNIDFEKELKEISMKYRFIVLGFVLQFLEGGPNIKSHKDAVKLSSEEYNAIISKLSADAMAEEERCFPTLTNQTQEEIQAYSEAYQSAFLNELRDLAQRWRLWVSEPGLWLFFDLVAELLLRSYSEILFCAH
ncbi:hypothetical protein ACFLTV_00860 [Chloroflexota bacterium]